MPCLAISIIPLLIAAPAKTPIDAMIIIVLKLATLAPTAELIKFTASLLTPTKRSKMARRMRNITIPKNIVLICIVIYIVTKYYSFVSENLIVSPPPGVGSAHAFPPCATAAFFTIARPSPLPSPE